MKFFLILFLFLSFSALSSDRAFIILDAAKTDYIIAEDLHVFKAQKLKTNLLSKHFNIKSNKTESVLSWLNDEQFVFLGSKFDYSFCINKKIKGRNNVPCNDSYNPKGMQVKSAVKSFLLDKNFSLFFPKATLNRSGIDGSFLFSNGKRIKLTKNAPVIKTELEVLREYKHLDEDSTSLYRFAHYMGLTRIKERFVKGQKDYSYCLQIFDKKLECNKYISGSYSLTGLMLYEFSNSCFSCNQTSRLRLKYYAANYLLRVPGRNDFQLLGRKIFNENRKAFKMLMPWEFVYLSEIYSWALKSPLSAR